MTGMNLENCIIEIKKAIARIEEQIKTIFKVITEQKELSDRLHKEHFDDAQAADNSIESLEIAVTRHDVELSTMKESIDHLMNVIEEQAQIISRTKGIAIGLGMAGGAIVSILTILVGIIK
ncbi:MAG: hypothetical protein DRH12_13455 [Deltaproteobacteria bacterium]|nr:MAG: hypothetical protein DRH12_13455 [Deltaproteobacteria bacterium]